MTTGNDIPKRKVILADVGLFYAAAIWGSTFFIVKGALTGIDPIIMVGYRFTLAGVVMLMFLIATKRNLFQDIWKGLYLSVILFLLYATQTVGLGITTASNSGFITGLFVAFIPLFLYPIVKRVPTPLEIVASVVALAGLWILTGGMTKVNTGDLLTLVAAMTYALHVLYSDKYMKRNIDPYIISCQQFLAVGAISLIYGAIFGLPFEITTVEAGWVVVFLALFPSLSAFVIQMLAQKITQPIKVSLIFALEPVFAAIFAWTIGGEEFVMRGAIGGSFIFLALIISGIRVPSRRQAKSAA